MPRIIAAALLTFLIATTGAHAQTTDSFPTVASVVGKAWRGLLIAVWAILLTIVLFATQANAATLITDGSGQLIGAHDVIVAGALYDVEFLDGSCVDVFSGCDELTDITFLQDEAVTAAQALLDQVFLGQFDSDPELTRGCTSTETCRVQVPRWVNGDGSAPVAIAINWRAGAIGFSDGVLDNSSWSGNGTTSRSTLARFTPVPEPSTGMLIALGLFGLAMRGRRRARMTRIIAATLLTFLALPALARSRPAAVSPRRVG